jgi:hypothetical protein
MSDEQQTMESGRSRAPLGEQTYVVIRQEQIEVVTGWSVSEDGGQEEPVIETRTVWVEIGDEPTTVPGRTLRRTVVETALRDAELIPAVGQVWQMRALDADSARTFTAGSEQPPPQLVIGEGA